MGLSKEHAAFQNLDYATTSESTEVENDRQKLPRIIKGGQIMTQPLSLSSIDTVDAEQDDVPDESDIHVVKNNGIVEAVEVRCSCGHAVRLGFDYETLEDDASSIDTEKG